MAKKRVRSKSFQIHVFVNGQECEGGGGVTSQAVTFFQRRTACNVMAAMAFVGKADGYLTDGTYLCVIDLRTGEQIARIDEDNYSQCVRWDPVRNSVKGSVCNISLHDVTDAPLQPLY